MTATVLVALVLTAALPGALVAFALGLRGWVLAAASPLLTFGLIGAAGTIIPLLRLSWSPTALAVSTLIAGTLGLIINHLSHTWRSGEKPRFEFAEWKLVPTGGVIFAILASTAISIAITFQATAQFTAIPQIFDAVWHSNVIKYITETGQSHPGALQNINEPATTGFYYPNTYHVFAATIIMAIGTPVNTIIDASVALLVPMLALGMAGLVRVNGGRPALAAVASLLTCAFTSFPYDLLPWGTLQPFNYALALTPSFLALLTFALRGAGQSRIGGACALGLAGIGLTALHPSVITAASVLALALVGTAFARRRPRIDDIAVALVVISTGLLLGAPLLIAARGASESDAFDWPANLLPADALGQLFFLSHGQAFPQYWLAGLILVGVILRRPLAPLGWFVLSSLVFAGLFVLTTSYENDLVVALTRPWWNDRWRFAGLWTPAAILLAAGGLVALSDGIQKIARGITRPIPTEATRPRSAVSAALSAATLLGLVVALTAATDGLYHGRNETRLAQAFSDGPTVSLKEREAFDYLARVVPEGSYVMNDPYDGSALMWALDDVRPVFASPVIQSLDLSTMNAERRLLFDSFNSFATSSDVRTVIQSMNINYVIVCEGFIGPASDYVPGMQEVDSLGGLTLVFSNSDARVYSIDAPVAAAS